MVKVDGDEQAGRRLFERGLPLFFATTRHLSTGLSQAGRRWNQQGEELIVETFNPRVPPLETSSPSSGSSWPRKKDSIWILGRDASADGEVWRRRASRPGRR